MPIKKIPEWNQVACDDLIKDYFPDPEAHPILERGIQRLVGAVHTLNAIQPSDHLDLLDQANLNDDWKVTIQNLSDGTSHVYEDQKAHDIVWYLDEMWQDAPLAMSPVRYQRLAFRIIEKYIIMPLYEKHLLLPAPDMDEFIGDLLTLAMGEHKHHYIFGWWRNNHGHRR